MSFLSCMHWFLCSIVMTRRKTCQYWFNKQDANWIDVILQIHKPSIEQFQIKICFNDWRTMYNNKHFHKKKTFIMYYNIWQKEYFWMNRVNVVYIIDEITYLRYKRGIHIFWSVNVINGIQIANWIVQYCFILLDKPSKTAHFSYHIPCSTKWGMSLHVKNICLFMAHMSLIYRTCG